MSKDGLCGRGVGASDNFQEAGRSGLEAVTIKAARADQAAELGHCNYSCFLKKHLAVPQPLHEYDHQLSPARTVLCAHNSKS